MQGNRTRGLIRDNTLKHTRAIEIIVAEHPEGITGQEIREKLNISYNDFYNALDYSSKIFEDEIQGTRGDKIKYFLVEWMR